MFQYVRPANVVSAPQQSSKKRYEGFSELEELLHPKLRPGIHINTVKKLIQYKFHRLESMVEVVLHIEGSCHVYFPWSSNGWAFSIFTPSAQVRDFLSQEALRLEAKLATRDNVSVVKNVWDPRNQNTDYKYLAQTRRNILLVFGDNTSGVGKGGSAAVRNFPNAFGIPTGWFDDYGVWTLNNERIFKKQNALEYYLEEWLSKRQYRAQVSHIDLQRKELGLKRAKKHLQDEELALRKREIALSQNIARFERRKTLNNKCTVSI